MRPWPQRPIEIAHLFNPAFCALLLREGVVGFDEQGHSGMPYPLSFVLLPIVLHKFTRDALPVKVSTRMHPWLQDNQEARIGFAARCAAIATYTREAVLFASSAGLVVFSEDARILPARVKPRKLPWPNDSESITCLRKARFLGRWMASAGGVATIFAMWGIRP
jgi:hypothetical protein